jgi:cytochrome c biogenesis protein CcdA
MRERWTTVLWLTAVTVVGLLLVGVGIVGVAAQDGEDQPVVHFLLFYGETCPHCHDVMEDYLPQVYEEYGDQVEYRYIEVWSDTDNYLTMLGLETKLGVPEEAQGGVPVLVIGDKVLIGAREIPGKLEGYIDEYLAQGGVDYPSLDDLPEVILPTPAPSVQILVLFDPNHQDFEALNALIVALGQTYGNQLEAAGVDITDPANEERVGELNSALGADDLAPGTPEVLIGQQLLIGLAEIEGQLPGLIEDYLAQGGVRIPPWEELVGGQPAVTATVPSAATEPQPGETASSPVTVSSEPKPMFMAYFEQAGCQECARTSYDLNVVQERYPQLVIERFSMEEESTKALNEWLGEKHGVPEEKRLSTPMIFVGQDFLIGTEATLNPILTVVGKYAATGAERTWDDYDPQQAEQRLVDRFQSFGVLTVLGAGLIDGLNPCAFATLVFFISYLAFTGRRGRDILFVGFAFTLGVFLTYLLVGVGLLRIVQSLSFFTALGRWVYLITALLCIVLASLSFRDYFKARKGQASEMTLKLPMSLRRRINKVIREGSQVRAFVAMAFFTGFVVSLLELACTGQVYLPTIMFVMSVPELAGQAFLYLVLYCLMFIIPLVVVFVLSYFGTTSHQLGVFVNRHTATIKLITGFVFVVLALWMTWTLAPLFGVTAPWIWILMAGVVVIIVLGVLILQATDKSVPGKPVSQRRRSRA